MTIDEKKAKDFIEEVIEISKKYGLSISHQDGHGSFLIEEYNESTSDWLREALYWMNR